MIKKCQYFTQESLCFHFYKKVVIRCGSLITVTICLIFVEHHIICKQLLFLFLRHKNSECNEKYAHGVTTLTVLLMCDLSMTRLLVLLSWSSVFWAPTSSQSVDSWVSIWWTVDRAFLFL